MVNAVTVGSATIDIIATIADTDIEQMKLTNQTASFLLMEPGRKVDAENIKTYLGGGGVNAAICLKRQGFATSALVKIGQDVNAQSILAKLESEGIDLSLVCRDDEHATAVSLLIASHDHDAAIFTHRGANEYLTEEDIPPGTFQGADLVYVAGLSNASADLFPEIVKRARAAGAFVAINPGIRQLTTKTGAFFDSLKNVDLFICNKAEARALIPKLVERTGWDGGIAPALDNDAMTLEIGGFRLGFSDYFARIHSLGPSHVGITDGARGAHVSRAGEVTSQPVVKTYVQGTTGAGDSFAATLSGALVRGASVRAALELAAYNSSSVVSHPDAHTGLLTGAELSKVAGHRL
ncbi:MAG: carbohydrate kinase family protein [Pseudomonadota bacterium]